MPKGSALVTAIFATAAFAGAFHFSGILPLAKVAGSIARRAATAITDASLDDEEKQQRVQHDALRLFGLSARIALTGVLVMAAPTAVVAAADLTGWISYQEVSRLILSWQFIAAATVLIFVKIVLTKRN